MSFLHYSDKANTRIKIITPEKTKTGDNREKKTKEILPQDPKKSSVYSQCRKGMKGEERG